MTKFTYNPINTLKKIDDNIWICDGDIIKMDMVICKTPFTTRMTVIKMENDDLLIHSPILLSKEVEDQINNLGNVKYLVAPNKIHYAYIKQWSDKFKNAKVYAVKDVKNRANSQGIDINIDYTLTDTAPKEWSNMLDYCLVKGSKFMDELVIRHKPSNTLIVVDLIENFEKSKVPYFYYLLFKLVGVTAPNGKAPLDLRLTFSKKGKQQAKECFKQIFKWKIDKIIMAHGKIITQDANRFLEKSFKWLK